MIDICEYGCGNKANHKFKNGKLCCSSNISNCPAVKNKISAGKIGKNKNKLKKENPDLCDYGCGQPSKYYFKTVDKWCCSKHQNSCPNMKENIGYPKGRKNNKLSEIMKGKPSWNKGIKGYKIHDDNFKKRLSERMKNIIFSKETRKKLSENIMGDKNPSKQQKVKEKIIQRMILNNPSKLLHVKEKISKAMIEKWNSKEFRDKISKSFTNERRENLRKRMINGGHRHAAKFIKKISKEELTIGKLVKELYSNCEFQYPLLNYYLDIAIPEYKLAIEFDGYYHFHTEKSKEYFKIRRQKIEKEGWKLISYTMYRKLPNTEELKNDINNILDRRIFL